MDTCSVIPKRKDETYEYLDRIEAYLGQTDRPFECKSGFHHWFKISKAICISPAEMVHADVELKPSRIIAINQSSVI